MKTRPNLVTKNLDIVRNHRVLINNFTHEFYGGCIYALVANNGAGKTTFLKTLSGLLSTENDRIIIDGHDINSLSQRERSQHISLLLQNSPEQPYCTAKDRIAHGLMPIYGYNFIPCGQTKQQIEMVAKSLHINHLLNRILSKLSGGEQRLVHIARCLVNPNIKILLLDEPSVFLDFSQQINLLKNLEEHKKMEKLVIFSSHDLGFIERCADYVINIKEGRAEILEKRYIDSSLSFLSSNNEIATFGSRPSYNTRVTAKEIGIST